MFLGHQQGWSSSTLELSQRAGRDASVFLKGAFALLLKMRKFSKEP
jgi:hypothetical protein